MGRYDEAFRRTMDEAAGHVREGRLDDACSAFRRALKYSPNEWVALAHLGACERFAGRLDVADRVLRQALLVRPEEPGTLNELALVAAASGRRADAITYLRRATLVAPDFLQGWTNLGKLLYVEHMEGGAADRERSRAAAVHCFDRILELDPGQAEFRFLRDALTRAAVDAPPEGYVAEFFDRFAAGFDEKVAGRLAYSAPEVASQLLRDPLAGRGDLSILDLGCGTGLSGKIVRANAARLVGVDLSEGMLERARALGIYDTLHREDVAAHLESALEGSHDLVLALDVFIYVGALERAMAGTARVLRPGAHAIFSAEAMDGDGFELSPAGRFRHSDGYVERLASAAGLQRVASRDFIVRRESSGDVSARMYLYRKPA